MDRVTVVLPGAVLAEIRALSIRTGVPLSVVLRYWIMRALHAERTA